MRQVLGTAGRREAGPLLQAVDLTKSFAGNVVLHQVSLEVWPGEVHAVVGENGAGKSTLINLITGVHPPDSGQIWFAGRPLRGHSPAASRRLGISAVHQELSLFPDLTGAENIFLGREPRGRLGLLDRAAMEQGAARLLAGVGLEHTAPATRVKDLPLAQQQLVEFLKATAARPRLLILDEATSALPPEEVDRLFGALRELTRQGAAVIFISHRLHEVFHVADTITVLKDGERVATVRAHDTSPDQVVSWMIGRELANLFPEKPPYAQVAARPVVLEVQDFKPASLAHPVSFRLHAGEILGLGGLEGQGQRTLLAALYGLEPATWARFECLGQSVHGSGPTRAIRAGMAYVPEDRKTEGLLLPHSVRFNLALPNLAQVSGPAGTLWLRREEQMALQVISDLRIRVREPEQAVEELSGGNQQKVAIGRWMAGRPRIYLLDEPTRGIDVGTKRQIYFLLRQMSHEGIACIVLSSDTMELVGLCDRVLVLYEGQVVGELAGDQVSEEQLVQASVRGHGVALRVSGHGNGR